MQLSSIHRHLGGSPPSFTSNKVIYEYGYSKISLSPFFSLLLDMQRYVMNISTKSM